jgi:thymidine kinase
MIVGPMWSGKSSELTARIGKAALAGWRISVFDYGPASSTERAQTLRLNAAAVPTLVDSSEEMLRSVPPDGQMVVVDEAHFFDAALPTMLIQLLNRGYYCLAAGLDMDFAARPFGPVPAVLAIADEVVKLTAVCARCQVPAATRTQRLVDGRPAGLNEPVIAFDEGITNVRYEPRCFSCFEPPSADPRD